MKQRQPATTSVLSTSERYRRARTFVLLVIPLLFAALMPRGFMLASSDGASTGAVTINIVFCSGRHIPAQTLTLQAENPPIAEASADGSCLFMLSGGELLQGRLPNLHTLPALERADHRAYLHSQPAALKGLRPRTRAPPADLSA